MSSQNNASGGGGFLGCFCRPRLVEDTGVAHSSLSNGNGSRSIPNGGSERSRVTTTTTSSLPPRHSTTGSSSISSKQQIIRPNKHTVKNPDIPLIPSPPSDDATPLMSNRKVGGTSGSISNSSRTMPPSLLKVSSSQPQPKISSKQNTMNIRKGTKIMLVKKPDTSRPPPPPPTVTQAPTLTTASAAAEHPSMIPPEDYDGIDAAEGTPTSSQQQSQRKSVSYYPNHVQDNVKVMREYYEQQAFLSSGSRSSYEGDATETTVEDEDLTESSAAPEDWRSNSNNHHHSLRVDCHEDPYESAYAVWYHKGLLKWRPKSVTHAESSSAGAVSFPDNSNAATTTTAVNQKDNHGPIATVTTAAPKQTSDMNQSKNDDDTAKSQRSILEKYRSTTTKTTTHTCTNCQKDLSSLKTISVVKCTQCHQELYCSVFCRGNDRYSHSSICPAQQPTTSSAEKVFTTTTTVTTPPSRRNAPPPGSSSSSGAVVLDETASASRSNSYKKSRQVPMVSLFGHATTTTTDTTLSARRLTTEFRA